VTHFDFNLVDDPWIVARNVRGDVETVSMREAFSRSHQLKELAGELPSQDFAVLRVLLAVLYRVFNAEALRDKVESWQDLWEQTVLPVAGIDAYLDTWKSRFNLFDENEPFFQVADLRTVKGETKGIELLVPDSPNTTLFPQRRSIESLRPAEAARWLIHCQAYDISGIKSGAVGDARVKGGKGYPMGIGFAGWLGGITIVGDTLRETLLLNLVLDAEAHPVDLPIWEQPALTSSERVGVKANGPASLFTWPQRRVKLFPTADGSVTNVLIANGDPIDYQFQLPNEPMTGWRLSAPQSKKFGVNVYMPRTFNQGEQLWRGLNALLPTIATQTDEFKPSKVLEWSGALAEEGVLPLDSVTRIKTVSVAYGPQMASWDDIFADSLAFNVQLASSQSFAAKEKVLEAVRKAKAGVQALGRLAENLEQAAGGSPNSYERVTEQAFAQLDQLFRPWLAEFDPDADVDGQLQSWVDQIRRLLQSLGDQLVADSPPSAWVGRVISARNSEQVINVGQAMTWFRSSLNKQLPSDIDWEGESSDRD